jgi:hypothetical protein
MLLVADAIRLGEPLPELVVDFVDGRQAKCMPVIPWRESLDAAKARMFDAPSEHEMPVDPVPARRELRERHPHLKRDPRFLGQNPRWTDGFHRADEGVEQSPNLGTFAGEMIVEIVLAACMRLIAVREIAPALIAVPERRAAHATASEKVIHTLLNLLSSGILFTPSPIR